MELDIGAFVFAFEPLNHLSWVGLVALLGIYCGIFLFFRGFRMLQHKRLILNTPLSKIRSASMGLVEVNGMAGCGAADDPRRDHWRALLLLPCICLATGGIRQATRVATGRR
jgi:hypothetical protein